VIKTMILMATASVAMATVASAQPLVPRVFGDPAGPRQEGSVRVQSSINVFLPGPTNESEDAQKLRDRGKRLVYEAAARECDLLREVVAKDCRIESISSTVNIGRQPYGQQVEGYTINGQTSFVITLK
jgi:hypothetical protein